MIYNKQNPHPLSTMKTELIWEENQILKLLHYHYKKLKRLTLK